MGRDKRVRARDGMGLKKKNEAGWDQTGQEDAGYGTGRLFGRPAEPWSTVYIVF